MALLFGIEVPGSATRVIVKPRYGQGQWAALYDGPVECDGEIVTDTSLIVAASRNKSFWEYVDDQVTAGRIAEPSDGKWLFHLSLKFIQQDSAESPICKTEGPFVFHRATDKNKHGKKHKKRDKKDKALKYAFKAVKDIAAAQASHFAGIVSAALAPVKDLSDGLKSHSDRDAKARDDAAEALVKVLRQQQQPAAAQQPAKSMAQQVTEFVGVFGALKSLGNN